MIGIATCKFGALRLFAFVLTLGSLSACATAPQQPAKPQQPLVYPPPPEQARFYFEATLRSTADLDTRDSTSRFRQLVTGEGQTGRRFEKPFDVSACQGRIYVSDSVRRRVLAFDVVTPRTFEIGGEEPGTLVKPLGIKTDRECNLYVADATAKRLMIYDKDGHFKYSVGGPKDFQRLSHVAVDPEMTRIYAVDTGGVDAAEHRVRVFAAGSGEHLFDFGGRGSEPGQFNLPRDIAIGTDGRVYVVDGGNFRVQIFDRDGKYLSSFGSVGRQFGQFARPKGIDVGPDGNIYVADAAFGNFQIFDPQGQLLLFIGSRSERDGPGKYMLPAGIDVDEDGRVYFVDQWFRRVDIYRPAELNQEGGYLGVWYREGG